MGTQTVTSCPVSWFAYILLYGKEKWVLVLVGSQNNCVEKPVWPMFPDYLLFFCDYDSTNQIKLTWLCTSGFKQP